MKPTAICGMRAFLPLYSKGVYVGNVAWATTEDDLKQAFNKFGEITSANIIMDRMTGRSRGFGFVNFESEESAAKAIEEMQGFELLGRPIRVNEAIPMTTRPGSGGEEQ
jgi:RNA recognition motif-containing protein